MIIGLAGGVGCGKTTVMEILKRKYQAKLLVTDELGHLAMKKDSSSYPMICDEFGHEILDENQEIDRKKLADIVYAAPDKLERLNQMIHPVVFSYIERKLKEWREAPLIVMESAILFESGCDVYCDKVLGIITDTEIRIQRLQQSRGYTREKCLAIMAKQSRNEILEKKCDSIVFNNGGMEELEKQLENQLQELLGI